MNDESAGENFMMDKENMPNILSMNMTPKLDQISSF